MGWRDPIRCKALTLCRMDYSIVHELGERRFVEVLQLATTASPEVTAWRRGVVGARFQQTILPENIARRRKRHVAAIGGDAVALRGDADDFGH
jgi:hypothetical protein